MPATEQTWRDLKKLHVWFAASSLVLLLGTLWLFVKDHARPWKEFQRISRLIDNRLTDWRIFQADADVQSKNLAEIEQKLTTAKSEAPAPELINRFVAEVKRVGQDLDQIERIEQAYQTAQASPSLENRTNLLRILDRTVAQARKREDQKVSIRKFQGADVDEAKANFGLTVRDNLPPAAQQAKLESSLQEQERLNQFTLEFQQAEAYRKTLQGIVGQVKESALTLEKQLSDAQAEANRLRKSLQDKTSSYFSSRFPFINQRFLELPILDAFNSPLKIDNLWTEGLEMPYGSFGEVRRFDRCTTCHQGIDKTLPGLPTAGAFIPESSIVVRITAPEPTGSESAATESAGGEAADATAGSAGESTASQSASASETSVLESRFGVVLAEQGLVDPNAVTVQYVRAGSPAATAKVVAREVEFPGDVLDGIRPGDVIASIGDDKILKPDQVALYLNQAMKGGESLDIRILRGLPQPYSSHPRLDLFVGSLSPHAKANIGCTVCHEGQGTATEFKWASHTPNSPEQAAEWAKEHGWFSNHHWLFPMHAKRFAESGCLKCHHDVVELRPSERFPEPPAPKVVEGHDLIREYGCFGCHEINGYRGDRRIGPDMRLEPNYFAAAAQLTQDPNFEKVDPRVHDLASRVRNYPEDDDARRALLQYLKDDSKQDAPELTVDSHRLAAVLEDVDHPGDLRKVGPSLRHVASKVGETFLYDWIRNPRHFRPSTRMPRFFGHWDHLDEKERAVAEKYEPIEILGSTRYLLNKSQPVQAPAAPTGATWDDAAVARGQRAFELRGCLACHSHEGFPEHKSDKGPNLSNLGAKFALEDSPRARKWLYNWLKNPSNYHPRTSMPDLKLDPVKDAEGNVTDPAADITAYLLSQKNDWQPHPETKKGLEIDSAAREALIGLTREYLNKAFYRLEVDEFLGKDGQPGKGIPAERARGAELELVVPPGGQLTDDQMLLYIGNKTISKYGCYACHDIPGFEDAKSIGAALADWGQKDTSRIAFEHIAEYVGHGHGHGAMPHGTTDASHSHAPAEGDDAEASDSEGSTDKPAMDHASSTAGDQAFDESFYVERLHEHDRIGFIWQKLKEPRSYDYKMASIKDYNDRLRMPLFPFTPEQREAVVTFVLGLVAQPPADQFVYQPSPREEALIAGKKVLEKFNCAGCHILESERWDVEFAADGLEPPPVEGSYPFVDSHFTTDQKAASAKPDPQRGTLRTTLYGMPERSAETGLPVLWDDEEEVIEPEDLASGEIDPSKVVHRLQLWRPALLGEQVAEVTPTAMSVPASVVRGHYAPWGGDLTLALLPTVTAYEQEVNPAAKGSEAWAWLPPPLIGEGTKVQAEWLHDFLLDPHMIRPATVMRMPKFNMSSDDASALVNFFAARDAAEYPYAFAERTRPSHLEKADEAYQKSLSKVSNGERPRGETRLDHAMNIVVSNNYCIKCHLVGDFEPQASDRAKAPDLSVIYQRLRPDYLRRWIAEPRRILPYTAMPVNIPFSADAPHQGGIDQKLFHGTSTEQVDGLVDLLMNFNVYNQSKNKVAPLVDLSVPASSSPPAESQTPGDSPSGSNDAPESDESADAPTNQPPATQTSNDDSSVLRPLASG